MFTQQEDVEPDQAEGVEELEEEDEPVFVVVEDYFEEDDDEHHQCLDAHQQPDLQIPLLEEEGMHHSLQEGSEAEGKGHEHVGGGEAVEVGEEVAGVLAVLVVVAQVAADGDQHNGQHEEGGANLEDGRYERVAEEDLEGSEAEEGEILQVALDE